MENYTIELFMPFPQEGTLQETIGKYTANPRIAHVWLWSVSAPDVRLPEKTTVIEAASLFSTPVLRDMAERASATFAVYIGKESLQLDEEKLYRMACSMPADASMAYSDYCKSISGEVFEAPAIDYQPGSLRNDFDFGSLLMFRTSALKVYLSEPFEEYCYAGVYQLRLAMSRIGSLFHFKEFVYTECENDNRKSGEKQFDYVNPAQRDVQIEMEKACTSHLKAIGGYLPPCKYRGIDLSAGSFEYEASVIIPVLNRESTISDAISSVLSQETAFPFNIIVVDNHSTDMTGEIIDSFHDSRVLHVVPERHDLGIGGCWELAVNHSKCGRFAVQLDSDDLYSGTDTLQRIVDGFYAQQCAMLVGSYRICDFELNTLPPGVIDHREWTEENGRNNALRINGLGAPRAFFTPVIREIGFPNVSYGEDYAVGLQISRSYRIGRIYDVLYLCRRWGGNSDAALSHAKVNAHNFYKDSLRSAELEARIQLMKDMPLPSGEDVHSFFEEQLEKWPDAAKRYSELEKVKVRKLENGVTLQFNPARIVSTAAKVDSASLSARRCFLCADNRPAEQMSLQALGCLEVLVNPFPILPFHLTLPRKEHKQQLLGEMYIDMLHLAREWQDSAIFYNGAHCGASAPDHAHLQAGNKSSIPLLGDEWSEELSCGMEPLLVKEEGAIYKVDSYVVPLFMVIARKVSASNELFGHLCSALPLVEGEPEPRMNVMACYSVADGYVTIVVPRAVHRPSCYYAEGPANRMVSPGALDMAGLMITPRESDFAAITSDEAAAMLREVAMPQETADEVACKIRGEV